MLTPARRLIPAAGLAAHIGHGVQRIATDAVIGRMRSLPRRVADLDAAYLSGLPDARSRSV
ncbi:phosphotransferase enzyme family protein [Mycolicibacterium conceptionense]|uniref:Phosphotransferase enzyme family protein n=1 Tax=Mycolicibacterium conceptionense TaxID=451644 RepID=A0A0U1DY18_9MYCO|nr:phosphotransferase enzyme family protein [Mycolicibacterium conceptionense]